MVAPLKKTFTIGSHNNNYLPHQRTPPIKTRTVSPKKINIFFNEKGDKKIRLTLSKK